MRVEIINVGDGACTVIGSGCPLAGPLTMIDCGTHPRSAVLAPPEVVAATHLGGRLNDLSTLIVTHFDTDHWKGMYKLASYAHPVPTQQSQRMKLYYPGLPVDWAAGIRSGLMALISLRDSDPLNVTMLANAWQKVDPKLSMQPLYQGSTFAASGRQWNVHWPPRALGTRKGQSIKESLEELDRLADEMANDPTESCSRLKDALKDAYAQWTEFEELSDSEEIDEAGLASDEFDDIGQGEGFQEDELLSDEDLDDDPEQPADFAGVPKKYLPQLRALNKKFQGLDNYLSLVVSDENGQFISFGDIEGSALRELLSSKRLASKYEIMLAPHHGSRKVIPPGNLPQARLCVSQNGSYLEGKNNLHRCSHHNDSGICVSTWQSAHSSTGGGLGTSITAVQPDGSLIFDL